MLRIHQFTVRLDIETKFLIDLCRPNYCNKVKNKKYGNFFSRPISRLTGSYPGGMQISFIERVKNKVSRMLIS